MSNLSPSTINNGSQSFRVYEMEGLVYPAKPITQLIPFSIYNLEAGKVKKLSLANFITFSLSTYSFRADFKQDDDEILSDGTSSARSLSASITLNVIDQERVVEAILFTVNSYPGGQLNPLIIDYKKEFEIKSSLDINRLTFFCEPIHLLNPIDIVVPNRDSDERR